MAFKEHMRASLSMLPPNFYITYNRFLRHPWSNLTSTFLNFEGAGSGGYDPHPSLLHLYPKLFLAALFSSGARHTTSLRISALPLIYMQMHFPKMPGIEVSSAQIQIIPCTLPLESGMLPAWQRTKCYQMPPFTDIKALEVVCRAQTLPSISLGRDIILWMTRSGEWAMVVRRDPYGL